MRIVWGWLLVGVLVMVGATWFTTRAMMVLELATRADAWLFVGAFGVGAVAAGAVIARHASVRPWCEPVIASGLAIAFMIAVAWYGRDANNSLIGPLSIMSSVQTFIASALVVGGAYGGALLGRRFTTPPSVPAIIVLSGLVMNGALMVAMGTLAGIAGHHRFAGGFVVVVMASVAAAGFATQAVVATKRPWTCASGGLLLMLLFVQEDRGSITNGISAVLVLTLIGWIGARIAVRVFRDRWTTPPISVPAARVES
ncbi:MAG: hypothetical protein AB7T06_34200 [Kofleriaceae bacterium]